MLLAVDIGNSNIVYGLSSEEDQFENYTFRADTNQEFPIEKYGLDLSNYLLESGISKGEIDGIVLGSVVPPLTATISEMLNKVLGVDVLVVGPELFEEISIEVPNPQEIGTDLVANALAAYKDFGKTCLIVDFGTALTFTVIRTPGVIDGVAIAPGLKTAMQSLSGSTAKLPEVPLEVPSSARGKNTIHAMQAGIMYGYQGLIEKMIALTKEELAEPTTVIATGGLSQSIRALQASFDVMDPHLTLKGLRSIYEEVSE